MVNIKELDPESSVIAAYGARLREWREVRGWSQDALAVAVGYSSSHISAVETARKPPTLGFSRKVDIALGLADSPDSFEREWRKIRYGALLEGYPEYVSYESRAVEIRVFQLGIIPGLLQTQEYARTEAESYVQRRTITEEQAEERVSVLAERQATLDRDPAPMNMVVMDESCLRQAVGGPGVMTRQFDHVLEVAALPNWVVQVAPFELGVRRTLKLPVNLLTMPDRSVIAYAESQTQGHLDKESVSVIPLLTAYHQLQAEALSHAASVAMIEQLRKGST
jgi:transcriptional regulator with XRE-family HTH domain